MTDKKRINTGFYEIFRSKLERMKSDLKTELERAKSDRRKDWIKKQVKECKSLQKTVNQLEEVMDLPKTKCPHCGGKL